MGTLGFEDSDVKSFLLLNRACLELELIKLDSIWTLKLDLRHAPLIISESGCNTNTKAVSTPREKLQDKLVLDGRRSPTPKKDEATRYRSDCMRLSYLDQDRLDLAETAKHLAERMTELREFEFVPLRDIWWETSQAALRFRRQKHVDKITAFVDGDFAGDPLVTQSRERARRDW